MDEDLRWAIGTAITVAVPFTIALIASIRSLLKTIRDGDDVLHSRINQVRDDYVRRIEFDAHFIRLREDLKEQRDELKETNRRLDELMSMLAQKK